MQRLVAVLLFFTCLNCGLCYTSYIHLLGYALKANTFSQYSTTNANDCAVECANTDSCIGFQMLFKAKSCNLLTMVRGYSFEGSQCEYYLKQSTNVTITGRTLTSNIDVILQNAVYDSQNPCPDGWTNRNATCYLNVPQSTCNEYASFLEASYIAGCNIPLMKVTYTCPDSTFKLGSYIDGHYCHKVISKWSNNTNIGSMKLFEYANQYCYDQTGSYLASIHSQQENDDINALQPPSTTVPYLMIGLVANSSTLSTINELYWIDGTEKSYTHWADTTTTNAFKFTVISNATGFWRTTMDPIKIVDFQYIACKQNAKATMIKLT